MHIHWSEDPDKGNTRLWFDGALVLDKKLKTKGPETVYFCQPGIHRSPHRPSVDTIYFDNFILADTLEEVLKGGGAPLALSDIGRPDLFDAPRAALLHDKFQFHSKQVQDTFDTGLSKSPQAP